MSERNNAGSVTTETSPMPGTHFHARRVGHRKAPPEYRGPGGLSAACSEASQHKLKAFVWGGLLYQYVRGYWQPSPCEPVAEIAERSKKSNDGANGGATQQHQWELLKSLFAEYEQYGGEA